MREDFGLGLGLSIGATAARGPSLRLGPELWPQPAFDASTGLTLTNASVTGGQLVFDALSLGAASAATSGALPITITDGMTFRYQIVITDAGFDGGQLELVVGGTAMTLTGSDGGRTVSGTATTTAGSQVISLRDTAGTSIISITSFSIRQLL